VAATEITPTAMGFAKAGELFLLKIKRTKINTLYYLLGDMNITFKKHVTLILDWEMLTSTPVKQ
jgi:hypothetical protein